jgi:hypothetical protein
MQTSPQTLSFPSLSDPVGESAGSRQAEDLFYQGFTIAAILLVLGSVWIF